MCVCIFNSVNKHFIFASIVLLYNIFGSIPGFLRAKISIGGGCKVIYIDTGGTFRPERVAEIARFVILLILLQKRYDCCIVCASIKTFLHFCSARGLDDTEALDNVSNVRLKNSTQQIKMIPKIAAIIFYDEMSEHIR